MTFASDTFTGSAATELSAYSASWSKQTGHTLDGFIGVASATYAISNQDAEYVVYQHSAAPASANYSVFADLTRINTGSGSTTHGVCGRMAAAADTFYAFLHFQSLNEARLYKWVAGTPTQLGSSYALTMSVGSTYNFELRMTGTTIEGYIDGVQRCTATDSAISAAGKSGILLRNSRASSVDNFSLDNFSAVDGVVDSISITTPVQYKVFQRSGSAGSISISGACTNTGAATAIEASFNGGAYSTIVASPAGASWSGTLTGQAQGQGTLTVRFVRDTAINATVADIGIGDVFVVAGDSISEGRGTNAQSYSHATLKAAKYTQADAWGNGNDGIDTGTSSGSHWPLLASQIMADQSVPVAFISTGTGGTDVAGSANSWAKNNTEYAGLVSQVTDSGVDGVKACLFHLGPNAVVNASTLSLATYNTAIDTLASNIAADVAGAPPICVGLFGEVNTGAPPDRRSAIDNIRGAIVQAWGDNSAVKYGPVLVDQNYTDDVHPKSDAELLLVAKRWWFALKETFYSGSSGHGPRLSSATWNGARDTLTVVFDRVLKTGLTFDAGAWIVKDNGTPMTISSIAYHGSNTSAVVLTMSAAASGGAGTSTVSLSSGNDSIGLVIPQSADVTPATGTAIQLPAEPIFAAAVSETANDPIYPLDTLPARFGMRVSGIRR